MIPVIPWYITLIVLATSLTVAVAVWRIFAAGAARSGLQQKVRTGVALFLGAWLGAVLLLAPAPGSLLARDRFYVSPLIPLVAVAGLGGAFLALRLSPALRRTLDAASLPAMIGVQLY